MSLRNCVFQGAFTAALALLLLPPAAFSHELSPFFAGDRILLDATLDGEKIRLAYDTGADSTVLFGSAAERLKLETENAQTRSLANHPTRFAQTKMLKIGMLGLETESRLTVMLSAKGGWLDGLFCWRDLSSPYLLVDGFDRRVQSSPKPPGDASTWKKWSLEKDTRQLFFEVTESGKPLGRVFIDTGASTGLRLAPKFWKQWRDENPDAGLTLESFQYLVGEAQVDEVGWAKEYHLGDLTFHQVELGPIPISPEKDGLSIDGKGKPFIATIGARALRRMRLIIRQKEGEIWTQTVSPIPAHNRLGAVFVPRSKDDPIFVARVLKGSPADEAGLKDGDVLLELQGFDFSQGVGKSGRHPSQLLIRPAGTTMTIKVRENGETREFSVPLRDLLSDEK